MDISIPVVRGGNLNRLQIDPELFKENERTAPSVDSRRFLEIGDYVCETGDLIPNVRIAYETWGSLNESKSNAVLVCHAISGDSHAIGWWDRIIGPKRAIDVGKYFVVCSNVIGGCQGTTGPSDGMRSKFPQITVGDMVEVQKRLIEAFGIPQLQCVCGGSMGGMQALEWAVRFPGVVRGIWMTASCAAHNALQIGYNEAARQAILRDPKFKGGEYDVLDPPVDGLAVARMIGHLSYLSEASFERKFGRQIQLGVEDQFQVESYLNYQGDKFTKRFDANSFLVLSRAIDRYECRSITSESRRPIVEPPKCLFTSFTSDTLYPSHQSRALHEMALGAGCESQWVDIDLPFGHDSFLLDADCQGRAVQNFFETL